MSAYLFALAILASLQETPSVIAQETSVVDTRIRGAREHRSMQSCSKDKRIKIYKFCINGDSEAGDHGEHILRIDGKRYYPSKGYMSLKEGQCHSFTQTGWVQVGAWKTLDVGTEEVDDGFWNDNDSTIAHLPSNDWYNPTCETYEVKMARDFEEKKHHSVCWSVGGKAGNSGGSINAGVTSCTKWTSPAESYIWLMRVEPAWGGCTDGNNSCDYWASIGECQRNPGYMQANCRFSCSNCPGSGSCTNDHISCGYWAIIGECKNNPGYMLTSCKKACGSCGRGSCTNDHPSCSYWAGIGECKNNPAYMLSSCKLACGKCGRRGLMKDNSTSPPAAPVEEEYAYPDNEKNVLAPGPAPVQEEVEENAGSSSRDTEALQENP